MTLQNGQPLGAHIKESTRSNLKMSNKQVTIIGAGAIGLGWAIVFAQSKYRVSVFDIDESQRLQFKEKLQRRLELLKEHQLLEIEIDELLNLITVQDRIEEACLGSEFIQECGPESLQIKQALFHDLQTLAPNEAVFASSSSAIKPSLISEKMRVPERFLVVHPANPPYLLPIVEVVPSSKTSENTLKKTIEILDSLKMIPILVKGEPEGFVFNRLQGAVLREAYCLVRDGVISPIDLDKVMTNGLGRRWSIIGPFATSALNVKGGLIAHAKRMAEGYLRMGKERGQNDPWSDELVAKVSNSIESKWKNEDWEENVLRRDKALMALLRNIKQNPELNL